MFSGYLEDGNVGLFGEEDGSVTEPSDAGQRAPGGRAAVESGPGLVLRGVGLVDLVVEPHVGHRHAVLGQGAGLVRADSGGRAQCLHGFKVLHQAVLLGHALGRQGEAYLRKTKM